MKKLLAVGSLVFSTALYAVPGDHNYPTKDGTYIIPSGSVDHPEDAGIRAHLNLVLFKPNILNTHGLPPHGETPASLACVYGFTTYVPGCPIEGTSQVVNGGWGAIGIVDAYSNPYAESDLNTFSDTFHLPRCTINNGCFTLTHYGSTRPPFNEGWADEHVLDIEWAHAMAPHAKIILVEAQSEMLSDLFNAVGKAAQLVQQAGGGVVSMSWGSSEFPEEAFFDSYFHVPGVVFVTSSGDYSAPARYPSSSPYVVSAGGTSINRDANGNFQYEGSWSTNPNEPLGSKSGGSGGPSQFEPRPSYQNYLSKIVGNARGTPDISFDSDPATGVDVYSTVHGGWLKDGGTSVAAPALSGIIISANHRANSTIEELNFIYGNSIKNYHAYWHDIIVGNNGFPSMRGYDFVTGLGSPLGYRGK